MAMGITRKNIVDTAFEDHVLEAITQAGFKVEKVGDRVKIWDSGSHSGNKSIDAVLDLVEIEGVRILEVKVLIRGEATSFEAANMAAAQGNLNSLIAKFVPIEEESRDGHRIEASLSLYADHLSNEELITMLTIFIAEIDDIDEEIISIAHNYPK